MLTRAQIAVLTLFAIVLWGVATLYIRLLPAAVADPVMGSVGFATTLPVAWASVWLTRKIGRLAPDQLVPGVAVVGAVAMMIDGVVLRWFPTAYADTDTVARLGAAWLLWGYGVSLAIAVVMAGAGRRPV